MYELLYKINSPDDLKKLSVDQLNDLCKEIRKKIICTVSTNGGHLSSNLGVVELTVAMERVFDLNEDAIVWDVGHQAYTHKILTGRANQLHTIRKKDGLSGFPNRQENEYDRFTVGHASTSISAALGIAKAKEIKREPGKAIAVIGDGALTGGLAFEGLNNAGKDANNLIVILNDNTMSISRNVGSISTHLTKLRTMPLYLKAKGNLESVLTDMPLIGSPIYHVMKHSKKFVKRTLHDTSLFEDLGFAYYGPINGHDMNGLLEVLKNAKTINRPVFLHVVTQKGRGYRFAEKSPDIFHGVSGFDIKTGEEPESVESFSSVFGKELCRMARKDNTICAITAAMQTGTSLSYFASEFPKRFFDVGIAEEHAITFAGGLSVSGMKPVCAIYSTFLQRAYDQIVHDAAIQKTHVVLAIDRAGIVGDDGETHQGVFDVPFLNSIPNVTIYSPSYYEELRIQLDLAINQCDYIGAVRYPRGKELYKPDDFKIANSDYQIYGGNKSDVVVVTYGRLFSNVCAAREKLAEKNIKIKIIKLNCIKPVPGEAVTEAAKSDQIFFYEESIVEGGIGERFCYQLETEGFKGKYRIIGISNTFVPTCKVAEGFEMYRFTPDMIAEDIEKSCGEA